MPAPVSAELGHRLAILMRQAKLKNPDVAEATGVDPTTVSKWRSGVQRPDRAKLKLIVDLARERGIEASVEALDSAMEFSSRPIARAMGVAEGVELTFSSATAAQKGRVQVEKYLLELAEEGAGDCFIAAARRILLNAALYDAGLMAGGRGLSDDDKLRAMAAFAEGLRSLLAGARTASGRLPLRAVKQGKGTGRRRGA